jgi:hypothetical protein
VEKMKFDIESEIKFLENSLSDLRDVFSPEYLHGFQLENSKIQHAIELTSDSIESVKRIKSKLPHLS